MMPAGTYYVGDLCYVMHDEWDEVCNLTADPVNFSRCLDGEFTLKDGRRFACYSTAFGDGCYFDKQGREYGVDAGLIGCILFSDIDRNNMKNDINGGNIISFNRAFLTSGGRGTPEWDGVIYFGHIEIETDCIENEDAENE
jgi:hypothetical protein